MYPKRGQPASQGESLSQKTDPGHIEKKKSAAINHLLCISQHLGLHMSTYWVKAITGRHHFWQQGWDQGRQRSLRRCPSLRSARQYFGVGLFLLLNVLYTDWGSKSLTWQQTDSQRACAPLVSPRGAPAATERRHSSSKNI